MEDKRQYTRVKTNVKALFKRSIDPTVPPSFRVCTAQDVYFDFDYKELGIPEGLNLYFKHLNGKLDQILSVLGKDMVDKEFEYSTIVVELSGGGLKCLKVTDEFKVGDYVEILLFLCHIPLMVVSSIGKIIRIETEGAKQYFVIEFSNIRDRDRELIVQFVFQEQREQIRSKKLDS